MANLSEIMAGGGSILTDSRVTSSLLTGFSATVGALSSSDTILQGFNKLEGNTRRFRTQLSPGAAELVGSTDEPLLVGVASSTGQYTHWSELRYSDTAASAAAEMEAIWVISSVLTKDWSGGNITVRIRWIAAAINGYVKWQVRMVGKHSGQTIDNAFDTATEHTVKTQVAGTTLQINTSEVTFTPSNTELLAGDTWWVAIRRAAYDTTNDTMTGDAKLIDAGVFEV